MNQQTKGFNEITELDKKVKCDNLVYGYKGKISDKKFDKYDNTLDIIDKIQKDKIKLSNVKNDQIIFKTHLGEIKNGSKKPKEKNNALYNTEMLYKARNEAIKFYDYSLMVSEVKNKATKETGLKILTPKQMLQ